MLETPLLDAHVALGARIVPFAGWRMPLQYTSVLDEARHVRRAAGIFDLCHMGRFRLRGPDAEKLLQRTLTNDVSKIRCGAIRYALVTNENGGVLDDVLCYRDPDRAEEFFLVVNAANRERDLAWLQRHAEGLDVEVQDRTFELGMIAVQGRNSKGLIDALAEDCTPGELGYYKWTRGRVAGVAAEISRTGYTGEDGFELYVPAERTRAVWDALLETGRRYDLEPIGLGARDTLRLEAGMALYGHELNEETNPFEAGLSWAVKLKTDFIGRDALLRIKEQGPRRRLVGLVCDGKRIPRQGYAVLAGQEAVGTVASGTFSPTLERNIATAFVRSGVAQAGRRLSVQARGELLPAEIVDLPFFKRDY